MFPAHGAGSPCGKNLSSALFSTIGEEKATNPALQYNNVILCGYLCAYTHTHTILMLVERINCSMHVMHLCVSASITVCIMSIPVYCLHRLINL